MTKRKRKRTKASPIIIFVIIVIMAVAAYFGVSLKRIDELNSEKQKYEAEQEALIKEKENLQAELELAKTPEYMEKLARRNLKLVKGNEILYVFPDSIDTFKFNAGQEDTDQNE